MKKLFVLALAACGMLSANAQAVEHTNFSTNWSIGLTGGVTTPLRNYPFFKSMRGTFGLDLHKQVSPVFGVGVEGVAGINTSNWQGKYVTGVHSSTAIDQLYVGAYATISLTNLFAGFSCDFRHFGLDAVIGAGWGHDFWSKSKENFYDLDQNYFVTKAGLNINWNVNRALTLSLRPSVSWNMSGTEYAPVLDKQTSCSYNANRAQFNLAVGVTYNFGPCFNCVVCPPDLSAEVAALNGRVNELRGQLDAANNRADANEARAKKLQKELDDCLARPIPVPVNTNTLNSVRYIFYKVGSSKITADQQPNVEMVAAYLKNHPNAKVVIKGYASKDGNLDRNIALAKNRAEGVKTMLVNKYKIKADRIQAEGQGIGEMFTEESWNRVSICTIED